MREKDLNDYKALYRHYHGREPAAVDIQAFARVVSIWGVEPSDAILKWLVSEGHIIKMLDEIPEKIRKETSGIVNEYKDVFEKQAVAANAKARADLFQAVSEAAKEVANNVSRKQMIQWAAGAVGTAFLCISLLTWYTHKTAFDAGLIAGQATGYEQAKDEKAAAAWANTPQGKRAYTFAQTSGLDKVVACDQPGWTNEKGVCFVKPAQDGKIYGWRLP